MWKLSSFLEMFLLQILAAYLRAFGRCTQRKKWILLKRIQDDARARVVGAGNTIGHGCWRSLFVAWTAWVGELCAVLGLPAVAPKFCLKQAQDAVAVGTSALHVVPFGERAFLRRKCLGQATFTAKCVIFLWEMWAACDQPRVATRKAACCTGLGRCSVRQRRQVSWRMWLALCKWPRPWRRRRSGSCRGCHFLDTFGRSWREGGSEEAMVVGSRGKRSPCVLSIHEQRQLLKVIDPRIAARRFRTFRTAESGCGQRYRYSHRWV